MLFLRLHIGYFYSRFPACILFLSLLFQFSLINTSLAGETTVLTPKNGAIIYAKEPFTHLVLKVSAKEELKRLRVQNGGKLYEPFKVKYLKKDYYVHFRLSLKSDSNVFTLQPSGEQIAINYKPLRSLLAVNFNGPNVFLFHRDAAVPKACQACHNEKQAARLFSKMPLCGSAFSPLCYSCHKSQTMQAVWLHSPAGNILCRSCHQPSGQKSKAMMPSGKVDTLCFRCHVNSAAWPKMKHVHGPVGTGDCTVCHNPHGDRYPSMLWAEGKMELCFACHTDMRAFVNGTSVAYTHGILQGMGCVACHSPHATNNRFQLHKPIKDLCSGCHPAVTGKGNHPITGHPVQGDRDPRRPGREFDCTSCHNPHGSEYRYMLIGNPLGNRVCRQCHVRR